MSAFGGKADIVACRTFFAKISRGREPELEARQGAPARTADRAIHSSKEPYVQKNYNFREAGLEDSGPSEIWGWGSSRTPARGLTSCRIVCALTLQAAALAPKGRLFTRCPVDGLTLNRSAPPRIVSPAFRASRIRCSRSASMRGRPSCLPSSTALLSPARTRS